MIIKSFKLQIPIIGYNNTTPTFEVPDKSISVLQSYRADKGKKYFPAYIGWKIYAPSYIV